MIEKKKIKEILFHLNLYKKKNIFFLKRNKNFIPMIKKNSTYVFHNKDKIYIFMLFYLLLLFNNIKFNYNSFLLFKFKKTIVGHNFIPDWPGNYLKQSFLLNTFTWTKKFFYIFFFKKKLLAIIIQTS